MSGIKSKTISAKLRISIALLFSLLFFWSFRYCGVDDPGSGEAEARYRDV